MPFYFDESIHERGGFILGAFVYGPDPADRVHTAIQAVGLEPGRDEYKSSMNMSANPQFQALRRELRRILTWDYRYGVVVLPSEVRSTLGREALIGLAKICRANGLDAERQVAHFDEGIFATVTEAARLAKELGLPACCDLLPEQDSRCVLGLQLADLVAHTCATMLLETLAGC